VTARRRSVALLVQEACTSMKRPIEPNDDRRSLSIVLAEDDEDLRSMLAVVLRRDGHRVVETGDGAGLAAETARLVGQPGSPTGNDLLIVSDVRMPGTDAMQVIRSLFARGQLPPFILITAYADERLWAAARLLGALAVFTKPFDFDELRTVVRTAARWPSDGRAGGG
jgi:two-component system response regulator (stage 0 sporulation protein F)